MTVSLAAAQLVPTIGPFSVPASTRRRASAVIARSSAPTIASRPASGSGSPARGIFWSARRRARSAAIAGACACGSLGRALLLALVHRRQITAAAIASSTTSPVP